MAEKEKDVAVKSTPQKSEAKKAAPKEPAAKKAAAEMKPAVEKKPVAAKKAAVEKKPAAAKNAAAEKKPAASKKPAAEKKAAPKKDQKSQYEARLKLRYNKEIAGNLNKEFGFKSIMQIPRIEKIVVSAGVGDALTNKKFLDSAVNELEQITGQKVLRTKARQSIANFKIREGQEIGAKVTLRGNRMYEFLDRLLNVALPRVKDFRGVNPKAFDGRGNYSLGIDEQIIFPEIDYDKIERVRGLNVAIVTTAPNDDQARSLLRNFGMPFSKE